MNTAPNPTTGHDLSSLTVKTLAERINAHLKRWEADPTINIGLGTKGTRKYYNAGAWPSGRWVNVQYISYQMASALTKQQAARYLAALDAGHIGSHYLFSDQNEQ
jgi:hypothetical protein